jgi:methyl-accepting chemotaxis protein
MSDSSSEPRPFDDRQSELAKVRLPNAFIAGVIVVCVLPFLLNLCRVDFTSRGVPLDLAAAPNWEQSELLDAMFHALPGPFVHTIFELLAHCAAIFTVVLAFTHYRLTGNVTTPVIGMALFCAGMIDAFHTLAADRLIPAVADNRSLIPFTWAISRTFNAVILIVGVGIFLIWPRPVDKKDPKGDLTFLLIISAVFAVVSYAIIHFCATSTRLPQTMFPDALITRPWDVGPLILFLLAGLVILPVFHRRNPSLFSLALIVSIIPQVATQLHMSFGSTELFDNHFHVAHFLKVIAYLVPLGGLLLDYRQTYQEVRQANASLNEKTGQLQRQGLQTRQVVVQLSAAGGEIVTATQQQSAGTAEQVSSLQEISTTMDEISQSGREIADRAGQLGATAEAASTAGEDGLNAVRETTRSMEAIREQVKSLAKNMEGLNEKTQSIGEIIAAANEIAEQTKMLALNASIEAARSGVEGSGFAVVAKQMKELADEAKASTGRVRAILEDIQQAIESSVLLTEEAVHRSDSGKQTTQIAERTIRDLTDTVRQNVKVFQQIVHSTSQQQMGIEQVTEGIHQVRQAAGQTSASTEHLQHAAENLNQLAQQLQSIVVS